MKKINVLFTCAGRRNYLINYFKDALKGNGLIIAVDNQINAPALIDADLAIQVSNIYSESYVPEILAICQEHAVSALISLNDLELPILSKNSSKFDAIGTKVIVSKEKVIEISFDKWKTHHFLRSQGLKTPETYLLLDEVINNIESGSLCFPLILKPRWGSASIGIEIVENLIELEYAYLLLKSKLERSILKEASDQDFDSSILIQEKIDGEEYGMDILNDLEGNYVGTFAKIPHLLPNRFHL